MVSYKVTVTGMVLVAVAAYLSHSCDPCRPVSTCLEYRDKQVTQYLWINGAMIPIVRNERECTRLGPPAPIDSDRCKESKRVRR